MDDLYIKYMDETYGLSGGGSSVSITPSLSSGTKVADYAIDGISGELYAPTPTEIEANPSGTATTDLTAIQIENDIYSIPSGGTTVVPNPTGTAIADLNSVQIGNDIYSIPSGGGGNVGYEESIIYNTPTSSTGLITTLDFSDADFLIFESGIYASNIYQKFENIISAETFKQGDDYFIGGEVTDYSEYFRIKYINNKTIEITATGRQSWTERNYLYKISKGKFVSGSTPSPSSDNGYYKETELYSSASSSASIILNDDYTNYDALIFLNKYNSGGYILDSIVSTTGIKEAADNNCQFRIHCGSDVAYIFGTVTSDTQFALTMRNYFVMKVIGINYTKNRTKALIPKMTSATTPSGTVSASSYNNSNFQPYYAFDGANGGANTLTNTWLPASGETTSWIIYEFDELKLFESLKTRTGGSAASNNVVFDVEGRKADGTWENCLASGTDVTLSFPVYSYTYTDTPLNGKEYNAIRLTSHSTMFVANQYGCGIDVIQVYGKNISS